MVITGIVKTRQVFIEGMELSPAASLKLRNHSPDGFSWGYLGSGPAQLALAILLYLGKVKKFPLGKNETAEEFALNNYQKFKELIIAKIRQDKNFQLVINGADPMNEDTFSIGTFVKTPPDPEHLLKKAGYVKKDPEPIMITDQVKYAKQILSFMELHYKNYAGINPKKEREVEAMRAIVKTLEWVKILIVYQHDKLIDIYNGKKGEEDAQDKER